MATGTAGTAARTLSFHGVHYLRKTVTYSDANIATGIAFPNQLPAYAQILSTYVNVITAFNAQTTNVLTVGQNSSSYNDIVASGGVDETTTGMQVVTTGGGLNITTDVTPYVKYTQTGTAATTGKARIVIAYVIDNDADQGV